MKCHRTKKMQITSCLFLLFLSISSTAQKPTLVKLPFAFSDVGENTNGKYTYSNEFAVVAGFPITARVEPMPRGKMPICTSMICRLVKRLPGLDRGIRLFSAYLNGE